MGATAERYAKVAGRFDEVVRGVPADRWDAPTPCDGWVARDVVVHLCSWMPGMLLGEQSPTGPIAAEDPVGAWAHLHERLTGLVATEGFDDGPLAQPMNSFVMGDLVVHTWDLARAAGLPDDMVADEVHAMVEGISPEMDAAIRGEHFGPKVEVPEGASEQDRLLAFFGRDPGFRPA